jgi:hypothetical protein
MLWGGDSRGAIFALEMARSHPGATQEPPACGQGRSRLLCGCCPTACNGAAFSQAFTGLRTATASTSPCSALLFHSNSTPCNAKEPKDLGSRLDGNNEFLVKHEIMPIVTYKPDGAMIMQDGAKVFMAAGKMTLDKQKYYGRTEPIVADLLAAFVRHLAAQELSRWRESIGADAFDQGRFVDAR